MVENQHFGGEFLHSLWVHRRGEHDHPLDDLRPLDLFQSKRARRTGGDLSHCNPLRVYALHRAGDERAGGVRSEQQRVVHLDVALQQRAGDDGADAGDIEIVVDQKLRRLERVDVPRPAGGDDVEEFEEQIQPRPSDIRQQEDWGDIRQILGACDEILLRLDDDGHLLCAGGL